MSYENKTNAHGALKIFELLLSKPQHNALSRFLPQGYSLELKSKLKKEASSKPTKKLVTNEGNIVVRKNSHVQAQVQPQIQAPALVSSHSQAYGGPTSNSGYSNNLTPSSKRTLRDHKKVQSYLEDRFVDIPAVPTTSSKIIKQPASEGLKKCFGLIQRLRKHNCAAPFLYPVDVEGLGLFDYYDIVEEPMDLSTVEKKLKAGEYSSVHEFGADVRKIWNNAFAYNAEGSSIYQMTSKMSAYFDKIFKEVDDTQSGDKVMYLEKKLKELSDKLTKMQYEPPVTMIPKVQRSGSKIVKSPAMTEEPMTVHEKKVLCDNIKRLSPESLRGVWEIVSRGLPSNQNNKEELVFDIDALPVRTTRELERYIKSKIGQSKQNKNKKEAIAPRPAVTVDLGGFEPHAQHYNHHPRPEVNGLPYQNSQHSQMLPTNGAYMGHPRKDKDDNESKSSDSSFISDSESGSDDERKHKPKLVT